MENIIKVLDTISTEDTAKYMVELITHPDWSLYKAFEDIAGLYLQSNEDVQKGIDSTLAALTGYYLSEIATNILKKED